MDRYLVKFWTGFRWESVSDDDPKSILVLIDKARHDLPRGLGELKAIHKIHANKSTALEGKTIAGCLVCVECQESINISKEEFRTILARISIEDYKNLKFESIKISFAFLVDRFDDVNGYKEGYYAVEYELD